MKNIWINRPNLKIRQKEDGRWQFAQRSGAGVGIRIFIPRVVCNSAWRAVLKIAGGVGGVGGAGGEEFSS
jgi:hypothetical protein